jgi:hypothetical protein
MQHEGDQREALTYLNELKVGRASSDDRRRHAVRHLLASQSHKAACQEAERIMLACLQSTDCRRVRSPALTLIYFELSEPVGLMGGKGDWPSLWGRNVRDQVVVCLADPCHLVATDAVRAVARAHIESTADPSEPLVHSKTIVGDFWEVTDINKAVPKASVLVAAFPGLALALRAQRNLPCSCRNWPSLLGKRGD